jgi:hypothetical protein
MADKFARSTVAHQQDDAFVTELLEALDVGVLTIHWSGVEAPVAGVDNLTNRRRDNYGARVRNSMRHAHELDGKDADLHLFVLIGIHDPQLRLCLQVVFHQFLLDHTGTEARGVDWRGQLGQDERNTAHMVFVSVR